MFLIAREYIIEISNAETEVLALQGQLAVSGLLVISMRK
jgi:hypothetical protein